jgi:PmbA protein
MGFSGKTVLQGASPLGHQKGERCFDQRISMYDDPRVPYRPGSRPFDDEGVPARRLPLVEAGVVKQFVYDLQTAGMAGTTSTGSASRVATSLPTPDLNVLVMDPGDAAFEDLIASIEDGLMVEQMIGSSQGNVLGGDFSGNVLLGYKIERGRVVGRVKDTMVSGNVYKVLADVVALSREARWVGGGIYCPAVVCKGVSVSSKG